LLAHQGLWPPHGLSGKSGIVQFIRRVNCIQYDPLNIVGRNPDLVLQSRVGDFRPVMLSELLYRDRKLLDGEDKVMSIYPVEDWPFFSRRRDEALRRLGDRERLVAAVLPEVRDEIEKRGPISSIDLDFNVKVDWAWGPTRLARAALESMYFWGELIVHHKVNTRRVYDFSHRHLPDAIRCAEDPLESEQAYQDWHVHRRIGGVGMLWNRSSEAWLGIHGVKSKDRTAALERLLERNQLMAVNIEGQDQAFYMRKGDRELLEQSMESPSLEPRASIIAPLDNLLWDRAMIEALFGFRYRWEVYKPAAEREYGYYVLPVLYGDRFVARFEPAKSTARGALVINNWWWEPGVSPSRRMHAAIRRAFRRFLDYLGYDRIYIARDRSQAVDLDWLG
jgi:uncharacterized protein YcaQ